VQLEGAQPVVVVLWRDESAEQVVAGVASQPLEVPNAGSVFRNPPGDFAARLIESCGLKGARVGGAVVSAKHANFIVNRGGAGAADIKALMQLTQDRVRNHFGITLLPEICLGIESRGRDIKMIRFVDPEPSRSIGLAWRRSSPRREDFLALGKFVNEAGQVSLKRGVAALEA